MKAWPTQKCYFVSLTRRQMLHSPNKKLLCTQNEALHECEYEYLPTHLRECKMAFGISPLTMKCVFCVGERGKTYFADSVHLLCANFHFSNEFVQVV